MFTPSVPTASAPLGCVTLPAVIRSVPVVVSESAATDPSDADRDVGAVNESAGSTVSVSPSPPPLIVSDDDGLVNVVVSNVCAPLNSSDLLFPGVPSSWSTALFAPAGRLKTASAAVPVFATGWRFR